MSVEGGTLSETSVSFDSASLTMRKIGTLLKTSTELEEDSLSNFGEWVSEELAWAFSQAEDNAAFVGDGTSAYGKIVGIQTGLTVRNSAGKITAASGHNSYATLDATDFGALIGALPARAMRNAKIFVAQAGYGNALVRLGASVGGLVASTDANGNLNANYCGLPVVLCPSLPASTGSLSGKLLAVCGDFKQGVVLGERRQITVRRITQSRVVDFDQVAFIGTERCDINCMDLGDSSNAGALCGLYAP